MGRRVNLPVQLCMFFSFISSSSLDVFVLTMNLPAHRVMGGEKSDEDDDGDEEDGLGDDNDSVDDKGGDKEMYAPVVRIGPLKD